MSRADIKNTLESICLDRQAIDLVMVKVAEFELEIERRRDHRIEEGIRDGMRNELLEVVRKLK